MEVLVIGDLIVDEYIFGKSERICPEAPVPVITPSNEIDVRQGGAGLVCNQLQALIGDENVQSFYGSHSTKNRIFVGNHLVCRLDRDSIAVADHHKYERDIIKYLKQRPKLLIVSDYGKGSFTESSAKRIIQAADILDIPVFVDAKHNWSWWDGAYAKFPNQREHHIVGKATYIIFKQGEKGCTIYHNKKAKIDVPIEQVREVRDVTGAGDIFLAAFAAHWLRTSKDMVECARYANKIASESVEHLGTYVKKLDKPDGV